MGRRRPRPRSRGRDRARRARSIGPGGFRAWARTAYALTRPMRTAGEEALSSTASFQPCGYGSWPATSGDHRRLSWPRARARHRTSLGGAAGGLNAQSPMHLVEHLPLMNANDFETPTAGGAHRVARSRRRLAGNAKPLSIWPSAQTHTSSRQERPQLRIQAPKPTAPKMAEVVNTAIVLDEHLPSRAASAPRLAAAAAADPAPKGEASPLQRVGTSARPKAAAPSPSRMRESGRRGLNGTPRVPSCPLQIENQGGAACRAQTAFANSTILSWSRSLEASTSP